VRAIWSNSVNIPKSGPVFNLNPLYVSHGRHAQKQLTTVFWQIPCKCVAFRTLKTKQVISELQNDMTKIHNQNFYDKIAQYPTYNENHIMSIQ